MPSGFVETLPTTEVDHPIRIARVGEVDRPASMEARALNPAPLPAGFTRGGAVNPSPFCEMSTGGTAPRAAAAPVLDASDPGQHGSTTRKQSSLGSG